MNAGPENNGHNQPLVPTKIMIVEDEAIVAKDIETSLVGLGYAICAVAASSEEALAAARASQPDLILMDIMLKGKLDGIETAKQIKAQSDVPVIFLTAFSDENTIGRAKETGAFGYLLKPFEERELRTTIEMTLYKSALERKLKQNREWLATVLRCITDGVVTANAEGLIEYCNPVAERLTGWTAAEMAQRRLTEVVCLRKNDGLTAVEIDAALIIQGNEAIASADDVVLIARDGRPTGVEYSVAPLKHSAGNVVGIILVLRDIAARQKALAREHALQRRLFRAQKMESVGMLASGIAEQLQRIIGPIVDYPGVILGKLPAAAEIKPDLDMIQYSARKAIEILGNLITLGQLKDFSMEPLNLNAVIAEAVNAPYLKVKEQNLPPADLQLELAREPQAMVGCKKYLPVLVNNLVFRAGTGVVRIITENVKITEPVHGFETIESGEYTVLKIVAGGLKMEEDEINRFFEPFAGKTNAGWPERGNGLETAVAYAIIKGLKGMVDIKSRGDQGTEIMVYFPVYTGPAKPRDWFDNIDVQGVETILVVDDEAELRRNTMGYLRSIGYKVSEARNGSEALEIVKKAIAGQGQTIDLVVLDMIMADSLDGLDTYKSILEFNPRQKAVMVSGFTITDRIKSAMQLGVGQCILKPYEHEDLARAIRIELDKPAREA